MNSQCEWKRRADHFPVRQGSEREACSRIFRMLSYARGPAEPLLEKTIGQVLADTVTRVPDHDAIVVRHQKVRRTWRENQELR